MRLKPEFDAARSAGSALVRGSERERVVVPCLSIQRGCQNHLPSGGDHSEWLTGRGGRGEGVDQLAVAAQISISGSLGGSEDGCG